ncbi:hypothetical protein diail_4413 [Diaporthe ilicicola]|nr:hypothetical protein diail_4413 [Diaporthe ilicicola]
MPTLAVNNFNISLSVLGGWVSLFGLVSYLCKEHFYLSEALISLLAGAAFSPHASNLIRPLEYAGSQETLDSIILYFSRLVLGIQLVLAGVQLPSRYLKKEWKPLAILLGPIMTVMWLSTSLLVWALVPNLPFLHALVVGSCITPTDPILSNVIVKGKFADRNVPKDLQNIIIAESGANDGLGYPFLFLALYLIKYTGNGAGSAPGGVSTAMGMWFGENLGYTIILSAVYGAAVGWVAKELLHWAEKHKFVDRESFLVFAFSLALFITGTCGMIGSDDVLACFIAGNTFTWDDWFRLETLDDSLQPTIDMLLNISIFIWYGAVAPWGKFLTNDVIPLYRLVPLGILILIFRRLPWVLAIHKKIHQIEHIRQAIFVGFFGPIGVSAIFYLYITREFLETLRGDNGKPRPDGKLGYWLPRTISRSVTEDRDADTPFSIRSRMDRLTPRLPSLPTSRRSSPSRDRRNPSGPDSNAAQRTNHVRAVWRIGGTVIPTETSPLQQDQQIQSPPERPGPPVASCDRPRDERETSGSHELAQETDNAPTPPRSASRPAPEPASRTIRFPDEIRDGDSQRSRGIA